MSVAFPSPEAPLVLPNGRIAQDMAIGRGFVADAGKAWKTFWDSLIRQSRTAVAPGLGSLMKKPNLGDSLCCRLITFVLFDHGTTARKMQLASGVVLSRTHQPTGRTVVKPKG
jgi:hypothetical protein